MKALFRTADGHPVEAVLMRYRDGRRSICVSSQSGCPLTCTFCATGAMKFGRNLRASEILDQVLHFRRLEPVNHLVFMGMGEPFLNFDEVHAAALRLPDVGITHRRTTISTVGWMPGLRRFVDEVEQPIRLALSIHAADPRLRSELMPVNDRFPLPEVLAECHRYFALRRRKVFVEYVMLAGVNDSPERAKELAALLDPKVFKVNLIPYNPTGILRRLLARGDRRVQERARPRPHPVDGAPHPRPRHRGGVRPARGDALAGRPVGRLRVQVVGAAGPALERVVLAAATSRRRRRRRGARSDARPGAERRADARRARSSGRRSTGSWPRWRSHGGATTRARA